MQFHRIGKREKASDRGSCWPPAPRAQMCSREVPAGHPPQDRRVLPRPPQSPAGAALPPPGPDARFSPFRAMCCVLCCKRQHPFPSIWGRGARGPRGQREASPQDPDAPQGSPGGAQAPRSGDPGPTPRPRESWKPGRRGPFSEQGAGRL